MGTGRVAAGQGRVCPPALQQLALSPGLAPRDSKKEQTGKLELAAALLILRGHQHGAECRCPVPCSVAGLSLSPLGSR